MSLMMQIFQDNLVLFIASDHCKLLADVKLEKSLSVNTEEALD